jgi:hypothetical protein
MTAKFLLTYIHRTVFVLRKGHSLPCRNPSGLAQPCPIKVRVLAYDQQHYPIIWFTNLGHNGLAVFTLDIAEGHLGALVLIELELGEIQVRDLVNRH